MAEVVIKRNPLIKSKDFPCVYECKSCGEKFYCKDASDFSDYEEEELWGHLQLSHEDVFEEYIDFETPDMIDECFHRTNMIVVR